MHFPFPPDTVHFNPRSREGSDKSSQSLSNAVNQISIHAPAKGATCSSDNLFPSQSISIHAPAKGATIRILWNLFQGRYFNPRSREGSDLQAVTAEVSGADFNPRSREGSDSHRPLSCPQI